MRKLFVLSALMLSALGASAQTAIVNNFKNFGVVPGYLTQDGMAVGYSIDFGGDNYSSEAPGEVTIVDNDFKAQKSFTLNRKVVGYEYRRETFEAQPQVEANVYSSGDDYYFWEEKLRDGGTITLEEFVNHGSGETFTDFEGYTCKTMWDTYGFFFKEVFGNKYPVGSWFRYVNGRVHRCGAQYNNGYSENSYKINFPTKGEISYEDPRYESYGDFDFTDYNQGVQNKNNRLSQTLFNNDSKWEYLVGVCGEPSVGYTEEHGLKSTGEYFYNEEKGVFTAWRTESLHYNNTAWQVRNEDGDVVMTFKPVHDNCVDFDFDDIFVFGDYVYLTFEEAVEDGVDEYGYTKHVWYDTLYRIDKQHNSAEMVKSVKADGRFASAHDGMVNVSIDAADSESDVVLTNAAGQVVGREHIGQGQTSATIHSHRLQHGVYNVSLRRDGRIIKNEKLMIK